MGGGEWQTPLELMRKLHNKISNDTVEALDQVEEEDKYLHEEESDDESGSLTVSNFSIVEGVGLHDVEETLLTQTVFLLEEVVLRIRPRYVTSDHLSPSTNTKSIPINPNPSQSILIKTNSSHKFIHESTRFDVAIFGACLSATNSSIQITKNRFIIQYSFLKVLRLNERP